jgi:hypothetical protein
MTDLRKREKRLRHLMDWYLKDCPFCDRDRYNVREEPYMDES